MNSTAFNKTLDRLGLSQAELGRLAGGLNPTTVFRWKVGERPISPTIEALLVLLEAYGPEAQQVLREHWKKPRRKHG